MSLGPQFLIIWLRFTLSLIDHSTKDTSSFLLSHHHSYEAKLQPYFIFLFFLEMTVKQYIHLAKVTKRISKVNIEQITSEVKKLTIHYQRQLSISRKLVFMHKTLPLRYSFCQTFLSLSVPITLFSHPATATCKSDLFPFPLIKCNFIPHTFFTENTHHIFLKHTITDLYIIIL